MWEKGVYRGVSERIGEYRRGGRVSDPDRVLHYTLHADRWEGRGREQQESVSPRSKRRQAG